MVVGQVGEDSDLEFEAGDSVLLHSDRADLHEAVLAALLDHFGHQGVDSDRIGCSVGCFQSLLADVVRYCGKETAVVAQAHEKVVEQGYGRGLSVCSGNAHQGELTGRIVVEIRGHYGNGLSGCLDFYEADVRVAGLGKLLRERRFVFIDYSRRAGGYRLGYVAMAVAGVAFDGDEHRACPDFT